MIVKTKVFLFFVSFLFISNLYGQDYYMYVDGKKRHYKVSPDKILMQYFDNGIDSIKIKKILQTVNVNSRGITKVHNGELIVVDLENASKENVINKDTQMIHTLDNNMH